MPIFRFMLVRTLALSILSLLSVPILAQEYDYVLPDSLPKQSKRSTVQLPIKAKEAPQTYVLPSYMAEEPLADMDDPENDLPESKKKGVTKVGLELGTSVSSDFSGNTAINTYVAPNIRHQINDRVAVTGGLMMSQTFFDGWTGYSMDGGPMPSSITTTMAYGRLDYRINERLLVYGTVYTNLTNYPGQSGMNKRLEGVGYSAGMQYKMGERSFLQIEVHRSSGYNPYMPYSNNVGFGGRPMGFYP